MGNLKFVGIKTLVQNFPDTHYASFYITLLIISEKWRLKKRLASEAYLQREKRMGLSAIV
jgi:hypothetical protein